MWKGVVVAWFHAISRTLPGSNETCPKNAKSVQTLHGFEIGTFLIRNSANQLTVTVFSFAFRCLCERSTAFRQDIPNSDVDPSKLHPHTGPGFLSPNGNCFRPLCYVIFCFRSPRYVTSCFRNCYATADTQSPFLFPTFWIWVIWRPFSKAWVLYTAVEGWQRQIGKDIERRGGGLL